MLLKGYSCHTFLVQEKYMKIERIFNETNGRIWIYFENCATGNSHNAIPKSPVH